MLAHPRRWSLAGQLLVLQLAVVALLLLGAFVAAYVQARDASEEQASQETTAIAASVAVMPTVVDALRGPRPEETLQPVAERVRARTGTDFVVVMSPEGTRYSHPNADLIGKTFIGTIAPAVRGKTVTETYTGTLGPSVRSVVPVKSGDDVVGLVSVGITERSVGEGLASQLPAMVAVAAGALLLGAAGTWLVTRRVRRQTHGLAPEELRAMYEYHDAVLHSVREGLLVINTDGRLHLVNDEAGRLLGIGDADLGRHVGDLDLPASLTAALLGDDAREDELHLTRDRVLVLNQSRARWEGHDLGSVATLRDRTELESLTGELDSARSLAEALRSHQHEAMNRMHTVVSLIELGHADQALAFAVEEMRLAQRLTDQVVGSVSEPALGALLLGKAAQASELGIDLEVEEGGNLAAGVLPARDLVTIMGNLIDNAFDATLSRTAGRERPAHVRVSIDSDEARVRLVVADSGDGPPDDTTVMFRRGWSTKQSADGPGRGLGLALVAHAVARLGGSIDVHRDDGAVFEVVLPVSAAGKEETRAARTRG